MSKTLRIFVIPMILGLLISTVVATVIAAEDDVVFCIGSPDGSTWEFGGTKEGYAAYSRLFPNDADYVVGQSTPKDWPFVHPAQADTWAGGKTHPQKIRFQSKNKIETPTYLLIGFVANLPGGESEILVTVNGRSLPTQTSVPNHALPIVFAPKKRGISKTQIFEIPAGVIVPGENVITITLDKKSWILYDYVALRAKNEPLEVLVPPSPELLKKYRNKDLADVNKIIFCVRKMGIDGHWYANFGHYADDVHRLTYKPGGKLCIFDLDTKQVETLIDDPTGSVRDPQIHYDGEKMIFSYRPGGTDYFHLYESKIDGSERKQLTFGNYDDIEPVYLPNGDIIFVSSRCNRWVQCWLTRVAILHRCDANGGNIREVSSNLEHDNTPWVLPNGQIIYTRWEYVDRSQVHFHHLWTMNPDGTRQTVFFGNMNPGTTMIDAKPVPNSEKVIVSFSPGHGMQEHQGQVTLLDPRLGPDDLNAAVPIGEHHRHRDPWAFSENVFMASVDAQLHLLDIDGNEEAIYELPAKLRDEGYQINEPRPIMNRNREQVVVDLADPKQETGTLTVINIYEGRNMEGVKPGTIKKLLIMESLPKPINFTGGMEPMSYGGTFTLERVHGVVPVEADGSASFELPPMRSFFFIALDENDLAVKRMQSFTTVMPGENTACVGCHEQRTTAPTSIPAMSIATRKAPKIPQPFVGVSDIVDFTRDVQPILNRHCVACHNEEKPEANVVLSGDFGPIYSMSYYTITVKNLVADGRNLPKSNYPPYALGSGGSKILKLVREHHEGVQMPENEELTLRLWIEMGAPYPGTYAALGSGMIGGYAENQLDRRDLNWPEMKAAMNVLQNRCASCHTPQKNNQLAITPTDEIGGPPWQTLQTNDIRRTYSRHLLYNLSRPEKSRLLLAPLAKSAGGYEKCGRAVFQSTTDPDYQTVLAGIERTKQELDTIKRFNMPGFVPREQYIREMKKYGVLPKDYDPHQPADTYSLERKYWQSLWHK